MVAARHAAGRLTGTAGARASGFPGRQFAIDANSAWARVKLRRRAPLSV